MPEPIGRIVHATSTVEPDGKSTASNGPVPIDGPSGGSGADDGGIKPPEVLFGFDPIEPTTVKIDADAGAGTRLTKSGRPDRRTRAGRTGSGATEEGTQVPASLERLSLTDLLYSIHMMGAAILSVPELELDKDESQKLSKAIQDVGKHYAVTFDPKKVAILNLCAVAGTIYGTRLLAYRLRVKSAPKAPAPEKLVNIETKTGPAPKPNGKTEPFTTPSQLWTEPAGDNVPMG